MHGGHLVSHWSRTQACIALSRGEAELKHACKLLGLTQLLDEVAHRVEAELVGDSSAAKGTGPGGPCKRMPRAVGGLGCISAAPKLSM